MESIARSGGQKGCTSHLILCQTLTIVRHRSPSTFHSHLTKLSLTTKATGTNPQGYREGKATCRVPCRFNLTPQPQRG